MTERASTATVLFTDMVGSTALRAQLGEERADRLRQIHDGLLAARVEANGGRVLKGQGDGLVAAFPAASDALTAAVQMQQALTSYNRRRDAVAQISVRIGLSVGDVSWEEGDCFGTPLVEAARLQAAAGGGEILCSEFVRIMARGRGGHEFRPIGFLELKGLAEPLAACEVVWAPAPDRPPFPLPADLAVEGATPFVSRRAELELAEGLLTSDRDRLTVLWILGEPGMGKTRLATEIARRAHAAGAVVLFGRCNEDLTVPYQPFVEALRWFVPRVPDYELADRLGEAPGELVRLAPEIAARLPGAEPSHSTSPEIEQHRLFEAVRTWLTAAAGDRPLVAVLDDVHWASPPTLALLGHIARSAEPSPVLLVCTARDTAPDENEALAALVDELDRRGAPSHRLQLSGLSLRDVGEVVSSTAGRGVDDPLETLVRWLYGETGGNPLFVETLLAGLPPDLSGHPGTLPGTLTGIVAQRVARLPADVADVLRTAAVAGLHFDLRVIAPATARSEPEALEALESAGRAGLVEEVATDRYRFSHGLVASALRDGLSRSRRVRVHLALGEALESVHPAALEEHAGALAHHFFEAAAVGGGARAYRYSVMAAERATRLLAHHEAAEAYGRALELLDRVDGGDASQPLARARLLLARGQAQRRAGDGTGALDTLRAAAEEAAAREAPDELAAAAVAFEAASVLLGAPGDEALELLGRAEAALPAGESPLRTLVVASQSRALQFSGRRVESIKRGEEAMAQAERLKDPATSLAVLVRTNIPYQRVADAAVAAARWGQVIAQAKELGDDDNRLHGTGMALFAAAQLGDLAAFDDLFADYVRLTAQVRQPMWESATDLLRSFRAFLAGDLAEAERLLERAEEAGEAQGWAREGLYGVAMFLIRREQERLAYLVPAVRSLVRLNPAAAVWRPGLAALYAEAGMLDEARAELKALAPSAADAPGSPGAGFAHLPTDASRELCLGLLAEVCAALGDAGRAGPLIEELRPCEGRLLVFLGSAACLGPADRLLGMLASTAGRSGDADRWHQRGLELARRLDSPLWVAHCLVDYAAHLLPTDPARAAGMLDEAASLCTHHNLAVLGERVDGVAARAAGRAG